MQGPACTEVHDELVEHERAPRPRATRGRVVVAHGLQVLRDGRALLRQLAHRQPVPAAYAGGAGAGSVMPAAGDGGGVSHFAPNNKEFTCKLLNN